MDSAVSASRLRWSLILLRDLLEVVDVVDEAAFEVVDGRVDVARDGDVDEEDGAVPAAMNECARLLSAKDLTRAGRGDDDVGAMGLLVQLRKGDDAGGDVGRAQRVGDLFGAGFGAVRDEQRVAPCWMRCFAARSLIFPAPTSRMVLLASEPKILRASSAATDAMETDELPICVSVRTRLATENARCSSGSSIELKVSVELIAPTSRAMFQDSLTWPRICGSPTTIESSELATRKRWRMASRSRSVYRCGVTASVGMFRYSCRKLSASRAQRLRHCHRQPPSRSAARRDCRWRG